MSFDLENYEQVKDRLPRFFAKYPDGRVITKIHTLSEDFKTVVVMAYLYKDTEEQEKGLPLATGLAWEAHGSNFINRTSHIENCETSAIGRALANIGMHGDQRPSREEMEKVQRMEAMSEPKQSAPPKVATRKQSQKNASAEQGKHPDTPARIGRMKGIYAAAKGKGVPLEDDVKLLAGMFLGSPIGSLKDASDEQLAEIHAGILKASEDDLQGLVMVARKDVAS